MLKLRLERESSVRSSHDISSMILDRHPTRAKSHFCSLIIFSWSVASRGLSLSNIIRNSKADRSGKMWWIKTLPCRGSIGCDNVLKSYAPPVVPRQRELIFPNSHSTYPQDFQSIIHMSPFRSRPRPFTTSLQWFREIQKYASSRVAMRNRDEYEGGNITLLT